MNRKFNYKDESYSYYIGIFYYTNDSNEDIGKLQYSEMTLQNPFLGAICINAPEFNSYEYAQEHAQQVYGKSNLEHFKDGLREVGFNIED
tara:strand:+ start:183 stop:452 length:270 start_codon:yes stop_codon:yes gene_type:complete